MNIAAALDSHETNRPTHQAILFRDQTIAYRELARRVRATALRLIEGGIKQGDIVGVMVADTPEHLIVQFALARIGAVILPMDHRWTAGERNRLVAFFGPKTVLTDATIDTREDGEARDAPIAAEGSLPLVLSLSSGTTGTPRGPLISHAQMRARFFVQWAQLGFTSHDRYVCATPLYFGGGRTFALSYLHIGGTILMFPPPHKPEAFVAAVRAHAITTSFLVPTQLRRLLEIAPAHEMLLPSLRLLLSSGAPLYPAERAAIRERLCAGFFEYYASTEGGGVTILSPEDQKTHLDSVGRPVLMVELQIADEATHAPLPPGRVGLIRYRGPGVANGFFREPDGGESFRDGYFYPGDLGEMDADGYLYLRGRRKDLIIRGGINVYPVEIEQILGAHPAVADAAVVGRAHRARGEEVVAFVALRSAATVEELTAHCAAHLAPYKVPAAIHVIEELPRNSAGKVLKAALRALEPS
jgi:acyl-CoA synthetase (AMP-forming)/AMP-acid ligase II